MNENELNKLSKNTENKQNKTILIIVVASWVIGIILSMLTFSDKFWKIGVLGSYVSMLIPSGYGVIMALLELIKIKNKK